LNPQSLNRYAYVVNNPTNFIDPSGYFLGFLGAIFGFLGSVGQAIQSIPLVGGLIDVGQSFGNAFFEGLGLSGPFGVVESQNVFTNAAGAFGFGLGAVTNAVGDFALDAAIGSSIANEAAFQRFVDVYDFAADQELSVPSTLEQTREVVGTGRPIPSTSATEQIQSSRNLVDRYLGRIGGKYISFHDLSFLGRLGIFRAGINTFRYRNFVAYLDQALNSWYVQGGGHGLGSALEIVGHTADLLQAGIEKGARIFDEGIEPNVGRRTSVFRRGVTKWAQGARDAGPGNLFNY
jgi:hypothetical protein